MSLGTKRQADDYNRLQNAEPGTVTWDQATDTYFRKGRRHTWHEIDVRSGERLGYGQGSTYKPYTMVYLMEGLYTEATDVTDRLKNMKREKGRRY